MIKLNEKEIVVEHFLDGTQRLTKVDMPANEHDNIHITWHYQSDEELLTIYYLVNHLRSNGYFGKYILTMPYAINARMDRVKSEREIFTLKWSSQLINEMKFDRVYILDPHSNVTPALLNNVVAAYPAKQIVEVINKVGKDNLVLYYPDGGAHKKYHELFPDMPFCYGKKDRDWNTGKINGVIIENEMKIDLTGKKILMIDDIIAYGGTMYYGAHKLKDCGVGDIYAYATHTELSVLDKEYGKLKQALETGVVKKLYTTDSIFTGEHEKIEVLPL